MEQRPKGPASSRRTDKDGRGKRPQAPDPEPIRLTHHEWMTAGQGKGSGPKNKQAGGKRKGPKRKQASGPPSQNSGSKRGGQGRGGQDRGDQQQARSSSGNRRGRGRGRRSNRRPGQQPQQQPQHQQQQQPRPANGAPVSNQQTQDGTAIDPFELFCAYHLGLLPDGRYKNQNINEIARRFNTSSGRIKQLLSDYGIDAETVINADFDMGLAQLDMMVAPEGIDRRELARAHFDEFMAAPKRARDWQRELAEDAAANRRTFGK